ncbi:hypothetical protein [Exiguobacterium acetylicum]|uniref:hypothetical protein n=1 Tax=Exiguobacterium acetylicum TaxID=41170 RepID=UPI001CA6C8E1|nr:hypothetical protein [Exiguobacterium acetylicum]QZY88127.1 hypothetical protein K7G97_07245 [Exiguobacterium acetylicum]
MLLDRNDWIDVFRELLSRDDWQDLVRLQVSQHSYPFEVKLLERPIKQNPNIDGFSDWTVRSHMIMTDDSQLERFLEHLVIEQQEMATKAQVTLIIQKQGQGIVRVTNDCVSMYGVAYEELDDVGTEYENFFDAVLPNASFPVEVVFCCRDVLDNDDSIHVMTLHDSNWQAVFEEQLLHLLNRGEITTGLFSKDARPTQQTLEDFMSEFSLLMPYNFIVTRDATDRFGMLDHFCTNGKIAHFGKMNNGKTSFNYR